MSVFINGSQNPSKCKIRAIPRFWRSERKIDVTALRGVLGVISMRRLSSMSGALEKYFSSTSLNIFFSSVILLEFTRAMDGMLEV